MTNCMALDWVFQVVEQELGGIKALLTRRGPDWLGHVQVHSGHCQLNVLASLLQLRGTQPSTAPLVRAADSALQLHCCQKPAVTDHLTPATQPDAAGPASHGCRAAAARTEAQDRTSSQVLDAQAVLAYNGELFGGLDVQHGQNDGQLLFEALCAAPSEQGEEACRQDVIQVLSRIRGHWAVIFWDAAHQTLWFGRDVVGRRSLLLHWPSAHHPHLTLTSIAPSHMQHQRQQSHAGGQQGEAVSLGGASMQEDVALQEESGQVSLAVQGQLVNSTQPPLPVHAAPSWQQACQGSGQPQPLQAAQQVLETVQLQATQLQAQADQRTQPAQPTAPSQQVQQGTVGDDDGGSGAPVPTASTWQPWQAAAAMSQASPWLGVPPGLYSLKRVLQEAMHDHKAAGIATVPADSASISEAGQLTVAGEVWQFQHHAWADVATQQLADFSRPASMIYPVGQEGAGPPPAGSVPRNNAAALLKAAKQQQQDLAAGADACQFYGVLQQAVNTVLEALRAAMQVRCSCIEDHAPHSTAIHKSSVGSVPSLLKGIGDLTLTNSSLPSSVISPVADVPFSDELAPSPLLILFSGGVDSTLLAALAHQCLPPGVPIDLSNVCFDGGKSPDRQAAISAVEELARFAPHREWRLILVDAKLQDMDPLRDHMLTLLHPAGTVMDMNIGSALWLAVGARGKLYIPNSASTSAQSQAVSNSASTVAGALEAQGQQVPSQGAAVDALQAQVKLGGVGHAAHVNACCEQQSSQQLQQQSGQPQAGAPGREHCYRQPVHGEMYCSRARVVIMGHGADEQCAGYGRHRTRYATGGWSTLADELALDVKRIWLRNLGRDDRLVADWGREACHPFLDEQLMLTMLQAVPLPELANLHDPPGVGDKRILRAALAQLGLPQAAARIKRAIQFGSRIGKASNCRDFGSNRAANKASAGTVHLNQLRGPDRS